MDRRRRGLITARGGPRHDEHRVEGGDAAAACSGPATFAVSQSRDAAAGRRRRRLPSWAYVASPPARPNRSVAADPAGHPRRYRHPARAYPMPPSVAQRWLGAAHLAGRLAFHHRRLVKRTLVGVEAARSNRERRGWLLSDRPDAATRQTCDPHARRGAQLERRRHPRARRATLGGARVARLATVRYRSGNERGEDGLRATAARATAHVSRTISGTRRPDAPSSTLRPRDAKRLP